MKHLLAATIVPVLLFAAFNYKVIGNKKLERSPAIESKVTSLKSDVLKYLNNVKG